MPYVSQAQAGYFHTHKAQLEKQGVDVNEWDQATKGKHLPKRAPAHAKGGTVEEANYATGGSVLPRSGDWKKTVPNRGFLDTPDRFTGHKNRTEDNKTQEDWEKTGKTGDVKARDKEEKPVKPQRA